MSAIGARYPCFKPKNGQTGIVIGKLVAANLSITNAEGQAYGDDVLQDEIKEFVSGKLAMETLDVEDKVASVIYGCKVEGKHVIYSVNDTPPRGELAYYKMKKRPGGSQYPKVFYYPEVQASLGNDNAQTKNGSITFQNTTTDFTIYADSKGKWRETEEFNTVEEAKAWIDEHLGISAPSTPGTATSESESAAPASSESQE